MNEALKIQHRISGLRGQLVKYYPGFTGADRLAHLRTEDGFNYFAPVNEFIIVE